MERIGFLATRYSGIAALLVIAMTVLAGIGFARLEFDDGLRRMFSANTAEYEAYETARASFAQADADIVMVFRSPGFDDPARLEVVRDFVLDLAFVDGVSHTFSVFGLRRISSDGGRTEPLLPADLTAENALADLLVEARDHPLSQGQLVSNDLSRLVVVVALGDENTELGRARPIVAEIESLAESSVAGQGITFGMTGYVPLRQSVIGGLLRDQIILNGAGAIAGNLVAMLCLRSIPLAILTGIPPVIGLFWTLGFLGLTGMGVNTVTNTLPVLILMLGFADSMHMTVDLRRRTSGQGPSLTLIEETIRRVGPACVLASVTTGLAFAALYVSDANLIRGLSVAGVVAILLTLFAVLVIHPLLFRFFAGFDSVFRALTNSHPGGAAGSRQPVLPSLADRFPMPLAIGGVLLLAAASVGYLLAEPRYSFLENLDDGSPVIATLAEVETHVGPAQAIDVPLYDIMPNGQVTEAALAAVGRLHDALETITPDHPIVSLWSLARWLSPDKPDASADGIGALLADMPDELRWRFVSRDGEGAQVRVFVRDEGARVITPLARELSVAATEALDAGGPDAEVRATGLLTLSSQVAPTTIGQLGVSFAVAAALSCILIAFWFRSVALGLIALVPNLLPITLVGAWMTVSGNGLQFSSALALTIAFGIAVDDTVHVLNKLRQTADGGLVFDRIAVRDTMRLISPAIVMTTLVLSAGMASTMLSAMPMVSYYGALTIAIFAIALIADLVILPACLIVFGPCLAKRGIK